MVNGPIKEQSPFGEVVLELIIGMISGMIPGMIGGMILGPLMMKRIRNWRSSAKAKKTLKELASLKKQENLI